MKAKTVRPIPVIGTCQYESVLLIGIGGGGLVTERYEGLFLDLAKDLVQCLLVAQFAIIVA